ncbi:MAG: hypothetical protein ACSLEX_02190 [Minisyncoccota bacterium]
MLSILYHHYMGLIMRHKWISLQKTETSPFVQQPIVSLQNIIRRTTPYQELCCEIINALKKIDDLVVVCHDPLGAVTGDECERQKHANAQLIFALEHEQVSLTELLELADLLWEIGVWVVEP